MLKKHKQLIIGILLGALFFGTIPVLAQQQIRISDNRFPIFVNGNRERIEGYNINGYTYLKLADFSRAGLDVKFNAEKKRIEVENVEVIHDEKGDENMEDIEYVEKDGYISIVKDGYDLQVVNGVEYIALREIGTKHKGYDFRYIQDVGFELTYNPDKFNSPEFTQLVKGDIPLDYKIISGRTSIKYNYFVENILPLINKEKGKEEIIWKTEKDGYTLTLENETEYISLKEIMERHKDYDFKYEDDPMVAYLTDKKGKRKLLSDISIKVVNGRSSVEYNYFVENILPLIK